MKGGLMKKAISDHLTPEQRAELEALASLPEDKINTACNATITKAAYRQLNWPNRTVIE
jgi:hypothetical protein